MPLNLYKLHSNPELLDGYHPGVEDSLPPLVFQKYKKNPEELKKRESIIARDSDGALHYAQEILKGPFPAGEAAIAKHSKNAFEYANNVLKWIDVPQEIIDSLIKDPSGAYYYARDVLKWQNVPKEIKDSIFKDPARTYEYAMNVLKWQNITPQIINAFATDPETSYYYAQHLKGQDVPKQIINAIAKNPGFAYSYAKTVLKGQNVPQEIISAIASNPEYAYNYKTDLRGTFNVPGKDIPQEIISGSKKPAEYYYYGIDSSRFRRKIRSIQQNGFQTDEDTSFSVSKDDARYTGYILSGGRQPRQANIKNVILFRVKLSDLVKVFGLYDKSKNPHGVFIGNSEIDIVSTIPAKLIEIESPNSGDGFIPLTTPADQILDDLDFYGFDK